MANNEFWSTVFLHSWLPVSHTPNQGMQLKEVLDQNLDVSFQDLFGHDFFSILRFKLPVILFFCPHDMSQAGIKLSRPREPEMVGTDAIGFFRFHDFMNSWVNLCPTDWVNPSGPSLLARLSGWPWWTMVNHYEPRNTTNWLLNFVIKSHTHHEKSENHEDFSPPARWGLLDLSELFFSSSSFFLLLLLVLLHHLCLHFHVHFRLANSSPSSSPTSARSGHCWTSTARVWAHWAPLDLNLGPSELSEHHWTSTARYNARRYAR